MAGIFRLAKSRRPPPTPKPVKMYGAFFFNSDSIVRAVSPVRGVEA